MRFSAASHTTLSLSALAIPLVIVGLLGAQDPRVPKTPTFAPAKELREQIDYFLDRINTSIDPEGDYNEADQARLEKDANLMILLFMAMAMHDEDPALKASAPDLVPLAEKLMKSASDTKAARATHAQLLERLKDPTPAEQSIQWEKRAKLGMLMKHAAFINNRLRRSMRESRFEQNAEKISGYATLLAVIAQGTNFDTHEVKDPQDSPRWHAISAQWRDAAAALGQGARMHDFQAADGAMIRMTKSCDDCHRQFRKED